MASNVTDKIKSLFGVAHGLGDIVRGSFMNTLDKTFQSSSSEAHGPHEDIIQKGVQEFRDGYNKLWGSRQEVEGPTEPSAQSARQTSSFPPAGWESQTRDGTGEGVQRRHSATSSHVPDSLFVNHTDDPIFFRSTPSTSILLLVCKRWLRVATPLLYEILIIRSKAQAQALSLTLPFNNSLGLYVKKLRIECGYVSFGQGTIELMPNVPHSYLSLAVWPEDNVSNVCASLASLSPTCVVLYECSEQDQMLDNDNTQLLCLTIQERVVAFWTNMKSFYFPYPYRNGFYQAIDPTNILGKR
ncbi:hypothetical protein JAAARDRAFT_193128 [Jaapia argillacea MUCL 33604]|uniref:Uncharacterized protein n=1 Tax=Jaapia argillacea MUCL 33604 TaxID=933084 RepID=A0A067Q515_9AGAM|nr:hypothetical protein JAAARDRAFT_193128 [Jaapia argillacea MUCL 33604]